MVDAKVCLNVYSKINPWIDFCILVDDSVLINAKRIVNRSYSEWFASDFADPIAAFISNELTRNGIEHEMYFKHEESEEDNGDYSN